MKPGVEFCKYFPHVDGQILEGANLIPIHIFERSDCSPDIWICREFKNNLFTDATEQVLKQLGIDRKSLIDKLTVDKSFDLVFGIDISTRKIQIVGQRHALTHKIN